ncbi:hypothetical protein [Agrococcus casei]|uniref:hypothetical protein n=1 Tax=Agrococcus casei TaxID=343512 RepID=UPI003F8EA63E
MLSAISLVLAIAFFALGIAQRTIWSPPYTLVQQVEEQVTTPALLVDTSVLTYHEGAETLQVESDGPITVIVGRTHDLVGWLGETPYTVATAQSGAEVSTEVVEEGSAELPESFENDLWQDFHEGEGSLEIPMDLPNGTSVLVIGDGVSAAPSDVQVIWPNAAKYPLFGPFITAGFVLLFFAVLFLALGLANHRRKRGPQRATAKELTRSDRRAIAKGKAPLAIRGAEPEPSPESASADEPPAPEAEPSAPEDAQSSETTDDSKNKEDDENA